MIVLNQERKPTCGNYAVMAILLNKGIKCDLERLSNIRVPYIGQLEKLFIEEGLIEQFIILNTPTIVDRWLGKGEWILTQTLRGDFSLEDNNGNLLEFDGGTQHFFVIIENCGDRWRCLNSWGQEWNGDGSFYMKKSDFKYLTRPRRVITK